MLLERGLVFDRTGQALIATEPDAISVVELEADGQTTQFPIEDARPVAVFIDQPRTARLDDHLMLDRAGRAPASPSSKPFAARVVLEPARCGPAATISLSTPDVASIDEFSQLAATEFADGERALPLTGRRFVTARGAVKAQWPDDERADHTAEIRQRFRCAELIGRSRALARVLTEAASMAPLDIGVLVTGPTGTGKSALARTIHENSGRAGGPFVAINCGAIPASLAESELFGVERGAHSTAMQRSIGKVAAARSGTLFLDEVGDLPYDAQTKLLQLLQDRQYYALGSSQVVAANVRVIAATNVDLRDRIEKNTFRRDLFYRLAVVTIDMPGLAERREDIAALVVHFTEEACTRHRLPLLEVSHGVIGVAENEPWPGQVRELANAVEAATVRATTEGIATLQPHHLFPAREASEDTLNYREATRRFQRRYLLDVLTECNWSIPDAVRRLGLARSQFYNLIAIFELKCPTHHALSTSQSENQAGRSTEPGTLLPRGTP
jgi:DNA-binding NtrC family response regulator